MIYQGKNFQLVMDPDETRKRVPDLTEKDIRANGRYNASKMAERGLRYPSLAEMIDLHFEANLTVERFFQEIQAHSSRPYIWTNMAWKIRNQKLIVYRGVEDLAWDEEFVKRSTGGYRYAPSEFNYQDSEEFEITLAHTDLAMRNRAWLTELSNDFIEYACQRPLNRFPSDALIPHEIMGPAIRIEFPTDCPENFVVPVAWTPNIFGHVGCYGITIGVKD